MNTVLITGGTGFIGSNLAAALRKEGVSVRILRRAHSDLRAIADIDVEHRIGDVRDAASLKNAMRGCDTVFHCAAMVTFEKAKAEEQLAVNIGGTRNVVEACRACGVDRLIHVSSVAAIGYPPEGELANEETPFNWNRTVGYKYSKYKAEEEIRKGVEQGLWAVMVNPAVVVGERDIHFHGGDIIRRVKKWQVPLYIDGGMNVVYVGDVVRGMIAAARLGRKGERYILGGENLTHKEIFRRTARIVGGLPPIAKLPLPVLHATASLIEKISSMLKIDPILTPDLVSGAGKYNWYSSAKAARELGYTITSFDETIRRAYAWYRQAGLL
jgi:dihydroflavonol-4-reductase